MKIILIFIFIFFFSITAKSQLDKGIWLVSGTGNFLTSKYEYTSPTFSSKSDRLNIAISPNIGYFIIDKLAVGLRTSFSKNKDQVTGVGGGYTNVNRFSIGPFTKYYFLEKYKHYNLVADVSYQYGLYSFKPTKGNSNTFNAAIGPVIYFNTSVGLEFLVGYYSTKETIKQDGDITTKQSGFQIGIGFQIHLGK
ncbi:MAG: hypothetical protein Q8K64_16945 [Sediminibacterium sp.]|nr:hypothetical protein [Sediminibacterium sp.]